VAAGAQLVDVRTEAEFSAGHLDGAINVPLTELPGQLQLLPATTLFIVYCASGMRAAQATTQLCDAGLQVLDLGPMSNWGA
jgi:phage shock protein E